MLWVFNPTSHSLPFLPHCVCMEIHNTIQLFFLVFLSYLLVFSCCAEEISRDEFPDGFLFGTATSSYQIEGAFLEDGKSLSNWDVFTHIPGKIETGENGDVAADHYHRYLEDIELIHSLGVNTYRFSISWTRILPRGRFGSVNPAGVKFYNNIIDGLLLKGIEPFVTINHQDIPQELEDRYGGFLSPLIQEDFVLFAQTCFENYGDRVKYWVTFNEPNIYADLGYIRGIFPPAHRLESYSNYSGGNSEREPLLVVHNMLISHAKAAYIYREHYQVKQGGSIGVVVHAFMYEPISDQACDLEAASRAFDFNIGWVFDPLLNGDYPPEMYHLLGENMPKFSPDELKKIKGSIDFIGINHYSSLYAEDCSYSPTKIGCQAVKGFVYTTGERDGIPIGEPTAISRFYVVPSGLEKLIDYLKKKYNKPIFVTENGLSEMEQPEERISLNDAKRVEYHKAYLASLVQAIRKGADVRGYFVWSLLDNFEWTNGYSIKFGLYYVNFKTLRRVPKLSAKWYTSFLNNNSQINRKGIIRGSTMNSTVNSSKLKKMEM